jgi:FkbM family methyltransferase
MKTIFDIGVAGGLDTYFYLNKGFNVVAVEADPDQVDVLSKQFATELRVETLQLINAVASDTLGQEISFYKDPVFQLQSSINPLPNSERISGLTINYSELISRYSVPYYCKIDIESADIIFLKSMKGLQLPTYISAEIDHINIIDSMYELGYRKFKLINQYYSGTLHMQYEYYARFDIGNNNFVCEGTPFNGKLPLWLNEHNLLEWSGLFGTELPGEWLNYKEITQMYKLISLLQHKLPPHVMVGHYDCHATV